MKSAFTKVMASLVDAWPIAITIGLIVLGLGAGLVGGQTTATAAPVPPFWTALAIGVVLILIGVVIIVAPLIMMFLNRRKASVQPNSPPIHTNHED